MFIECITGFVIRKPYVYKHDFFFSWLVEEEEGGGGRKRSVIAWLSRA
jgi:hypothetical protein